MKTIPFKLSLLAIGLLFILPSCNGPVYVESTPPPPPPQQQYYSDQQVPDQGSNQVQEASAPVNYQSFYNELSPYGQWMNTPDYGYVWVPSAGVDFQPYATNGHWVLTNYGWTWVSDYSWGWAPFHYGTWDFDGTIGWYWIPGYQWAPAWVSWRSEPGYYGWAPLGPTYTSGGYANYYCPPERYVFVSASYINSPDLGRYYEPRQRNSGYFEHSSIVGNTYYDKGSNNTYYSGPRGDEVQRYTGAPVRPVSLVQASSPEGSSLSGNQVRMYRPSIIQQPANNGAKPAPQQVYQRNDVNPVQQRQVLTRPNQPRTPPSNQGNAQHPNNTIPQEQNRGQQPQPRQEQPQQRPAAPQQQAPAQQQTPARQPQAPVQQQTPAQQQQSAPAQQPQYHAPAQQQQTPAQQPQYRAPAQQQQSAPAQQPQYHAPAQQQAPVRQQPASPAQQHRPAQQGPARQQKQQGKQQQKQATPQAKQQPQGQEQQGK